MLIAIQNSEANAPESGLKIKPGNWAEMGGTTGGDERLGNHSSSHQFRDHFLASFLVPHFNNMTLTVSNVI